MERKLGRLANFLSCSQRWSASLWLAVTDQLNVWATSRDLGAYPSAESDQRENSSLLSEFGAASVQCFSILLPLSQSGWVWHFPDGLGVPRPIYD
jgi:hypothetical protein